VLRILSSAIPFYRHRFAHFLQFFLLGADLRAAAGGNFLQVAALGRLKKARPAGTDKDAALLDLAVKAAEQAVEGFVVFLLYFYQNTHSPFNLRMTKL
jgi:hypothetical protein